MKKLVYAALAFAPILALAQNNANTTINNVTSLTQNIKTLINAIIPVLFGLAIIYFFWGLIQYIRSAGDPKAAAAGKSIMIYGIIALVVMVAVYGLINWVASTAGVSTTGTVTLPQIQ